MSEEDGGVSVGAWRGYVGFLGETGKEMGG